VEQKKTNENKIFEGKALSLYLSNFMNSKGRDIEREVVKRKKAAGILAVTSKGNIIMVRQYRQAVEQLLWEIPAGLIDRAEIASDAAQRELIEETGYKASKICEISRFYSSAGFTNEEVIIFKASGLEYVGAAPDDEEEFEIEEFNLETALDMIDSKEIIDAKTIIALLLFFKEKTVSPMAE
jgi:ADP-ribose pyrophosphatase